MNKFLLLTVLFIFGLNAFAEDPQILELKKEIVGLAKLYEGKPDKDGKAHQLIEKKVEDLEKLLPFLTMEEKAKKIVGAWRQVFGPYSAKNDGKVPRTSSTKHIYQIIFPDGFFYNVALSEFRNYRAVILLKGVYEVTESAIEARFVANSVLFKDIPSIPYFELPGMLERKEIKPFKLPSRIPPVGQSGQLIEVYADEDIRILRGKSPTFKKTAILIMERAR